MSNDLGLSPLTELTLWGVEEVASMFISWPSLLASSYSVVLDIMPKVLRHGFIFKSRRRGLSKFGCFYSFLKKVHT